MEVLRPGWLKNTFGRLDTLDLMELEFRRAPADAVFGFVVESVVMVGIPVAPPAIGPHPEQLLLAVIDHAGSAQSFGIFVVEESLTRDEGIGWVSHRLMHDPPTAGSIFNHIPVHQ